jgi:hypothetical protein
MSVTRRSFLASLGALVALPVVSPIFRPSCESVRASAEPARLVLGPNGERLRVMHVRPFTEQWDELVRQTNVRHGLSPKGSALR